jgi:hypothetical protein
MLILIVLPNSRPVNAVTQHPAARERVVEVQLVDPPHDRQIGGRRRTRIVIQATADPQQFGRSAQCQPVSAVDHRFALGNPALPSAADKKSLSSVSSPSFACSVFRSAPVFGGCAANRS